MMKNGYDQFFKNARKAATQASPPEKGPRPKVKTKTSFKLSEEDLETQLKRRMGMNTQKKNKIKKKFPWQLVGVSFLGVLVTFWGVENYVQVENYLKRIEVSFMGVASAEEKTPKKAEAAPTDKVPTEKSAPSDPQKPDEDSDSQYDHFSKLNERKKELDEREEELNRLEQELQTQRGELEKRLKELEDVRRGISSVLEDKVKVDDKKVDTLVLMYSDMKPPQAAKVFETMDEDLAVEILGRMKKKSAADIMNLLKPEKAQVLSEKFAGYKRK